MIETPVVVCGSLRRLAPFRPGEFGALSPRRFGLSDDAGKIVACIGDLGMDSSETGAESNDFRTQSSVRFGIERISNESDHRDEDISHVSLELETRASDSENAGGFLAL